MSTSTETGNHRNTTGTAQEPPQRNPVHPAGFGIRALGIGMILVVCGGLIVDGLRDISDLPPRPNRPRGRSKEASDDADHEGLRAERHRTRPLGERGSRVGSVVQRARPVGRGALGVRRYCQEDHRHLARPEAALVDESTVASSAPSLHEVSSRFAEPGPRRCDSEWRGVGA